MKNKSSHYLDPEALLRATPNLSSSAFERNKQIVLHHFRQEFSPSVPLLKKLAAPLILGSILLGSLLFVVIRHEVNKNIEINTIQSDLNSLDIQEEHFL